MASNLYLGEKQQNARISFVPTQSFSNRKKSTDPIKWINIQKWALLKATG